LFISFTINEYYKIIKKMLVRVNNLKIELLAADAKPGGIIGAMLSPYLFSANMNDFCKKFNEQTKDYESDIFLTVEIWAETVEKIYTFKIKILSVGRFILYFLVMFKRFTIFNFYDLILYYTKIYMMSFYKLTILILSVLRAIKRRKFKIKFVPYIFKKYRVALTG